MATTNGDAYSNASSSSRQPHVIQGPGPDSGSTASNSSTSSIKTCFFMRDGDTYTRPKKFVVNPRYYPSIDCVQEELGIKMDMGVRTIFTPAGRHAIRTCDDLRQDGHYICSTRRLRAKGIDLQKLASRPTWHGGGRASSGRRQYNSLLSYRNSNRFVNRVKAGSTSTYSSSPESKNSLMLGSPKTPKRILITQLGHADRCHQLLLNPKTQQTFEDLLRDIGTMFDIRTPKLYTGEGKIIVSMASLLKGPDRLIVKEHGFKRKKDLAKTRGRWKVRIKTGYEESCGTTAQVTLTVYGEKGNSGPIPLGYSDGEDFHSGDVNEFEVSVGNIGEVFKIRIAHDNSGDDPSWFCESVMMADMHTDELLEFNCYRWMARDHEDQDICRELPVIRGNMPVLPIVIYEVTVVTGDLWNAGTEANVYITIYGQYGDTGVRQLIDEEKTGKFIKGEVDVFHIEAVSLGHLSRVIVGHDGTGKGNGWYLDRVIIRADINGPEQEFPCRRWLDDNEEDGKIVRELKLQAQRPDIIDKQLFEYQKWKFQPGAVIMLYSPVVQRPIRIRSDASVDARGEYKDEAALFQPVMRRGLVRVLQSVSNPMFHLGIDHGRIMGQSRGGGFGEFKVRVQDDCSVQFESTKQINNRLNIKDNGRPGDPLNQSYTHSTFFVYAKGMFRDEGVILLCTSLTQAIDIEHDGTLNATGRRTHLAQFRVHKIQVPEGGVRMLESVVFPKKYIRMREGQVDLQGKGDEYCHFRLHRIREKGCVSFESVVYKNLFLGMTAEGLIRPSIDSGGKNTRFYPEIIEYGIKKSMAREPTPPVQMKPKKHVKRRTREDDEPPTKRSPPPYEEDRVISGIPSTVPSKPESSLSDQEEGDWKVWIMTEEAAENAEVVMVAYGDRGNSGPIFLGSAGQNELFLSGNIDQFKVNLARIGKLYKIRMELHSADGIVEPHWKLKEIKMKDLKTAETLRFRFNRYLSTHEDDLDVCRELPAIRPRQDVLPVIKYAVHVITGREPAANTDASLYIQLYGDRGDTGKRALRQSQNKERFVEGQEDVFHVEAVSLGRMTHCIIGHDGKDPGEGWFCEKVFVKEDEENIFYFPCNKWLDAGVGDKKIERCLKVKDPVPWLKQSSPPEDGNDDSSEEAAVPKWEEEPMVVEEVTDPDHSIYVTPGQGTQVPDELVLFVYGSKGVSDPITLSNGDLSQKGSTIEFKQDIPNGLGELYKIRVGYEDVEMYINWYLQKMKIKNRVTNELLSFDAKHWLSKSEGDCDVWRELPVVRPGEDPLPVVKYVLEVYTGDVPGADTEANVYVHIKGTRGDSGKRFLYKSQNNDAKFQRGQMDVFAVNAVSLEDIDELIVGHDGVGKGAGWYIDKIVIKEELPTPLPQKAAPPPKKPAGNKPRNRRRANYNNHNNLNTNNSNGNTNGPPEGRCWFFEINQWLDTGMGDGQLECTVKAEKTPKEEPEVIAVSDNDEVLEGTTANRAATATLRHASPSEGNSLMPHISNGNISPTELPDAPGAAVRAANTNGTASPTTRPAVSNGNISPIGRESTPVAKAGPTPETAVAVQNTVSRHASPAGQRKEGYIDTTAAAATEEPAIARQLASAGALVMRLAIGTPNTDEYQQATNESPSSKKPGVHDDNLLKPPVVNIDLEEDVLNENHGAEIDDRTFGSPDNESVSTPRSGSMDLPTTAMQVDTDVPVTPRAFTTDFPQASITDGITTEKPDTPYPMTVSPLDVTGQDTLMSAGSERSLSVQKNRHTSSKHRRRSRTKSTTSKEPTIVIETVEDEPRDVNNLPVPQLQSIEQSQNSPDLPPDTGMNSVRDRTPSVEGDQIQVTKEEEKVVEALDSAIAVESVAAATEQPETSSQETTWAVSLLPDKITRLPYEMTMFIIGENKESPSIVFSDMTYTQKTHCYEFKHGLYDDLGDWFKIRLGHEDLDSAFNWHLEKVKMKNTETNELMTFASHHLPSTDLCDSWRELGLIKPGKPLLPVIFYTIEVYTGSEPGADTEAEVFVQLFGNRGDSGKRKLAYSLSNAIRFQQGQMDVFKLQAVSLDELQKIVIGHDDPGKGAGWFLEKVIIKEEFPPEPEPEPPVKQKPSRAGGRGTEPRARAKQAPRKPGGRNQNYNNNKPEPRTWQFICDMWFDSGIGDGKIERELYPSDMMDVNDDVEVVAMEPGPEWDITIETKRGTKNEVSLYVYGNKGKSGPHVLGTGADLEYFQTGSVDEFQQEIVDVGEWYKVRIGHCDTDPTSGWLLHSMVMKNQLKEEMYTFEVNRWMSRTEDDHDVWRELPVKIPGKRPLPVVVYNVEVYTGKEPGSDTLAMVFIELHGSRGDSGQRILYDSLTNFTKFRRGQMDLFQIEAVSLDDIKKIVVGHSEKMKGGGWYLDKIVIKEELPEDDEEEEEEQAPSPKKSKTTKKGQGDQSRGRKAAGKKGQNTNNNAGGKKQGRVWTFTCECWLDKGVGEKRIVQEFEPSHQEIIEPSPSPEQEPEPDWKLLVTTGKDASGKEASTTNDVSLYVYGDKGCDGPLLLGSGADGEYFQQGKTDCFAHDIKDIGEWYKVRIGHNDADRKSGWFLDNLKMSNEKIDEQYTFKVKRWLSRLEDDHDVWRELPVVRPEKSPLPVVKYTIEVYTGDEDNAETEAEVYIQLHGSRGDTGRRVLFHSLNNDTKFQRGEMDMFEIEAVSLDEVEKIVIGHTETAKGGGWYLDHVIIKEELLPDPPPPAKKAKSKSIPSESSPTDKRSKSKSTPQNPPEGKAKGRRAPRGANANNHNNRLSTSSSDEEENIDEIIEEIEEDEEDREEDEAYDDDDCEDGNMNNSNDEKKAEPRVWYVDCKMWLDSGVSDGLIERELVCGPEPKPDDEPDWNIMVTTGKDEEMATTNEVSMYVYGEKGMAGPMVLGKGADKEYFQEGHTDEFKRDFPELGDMYKIRIGHNDADPASGWFLEKVKMRHVKTDELFTFKVKQWMSRLHEDHDIWRELPVLYPGKRGLPVLTYTIEVYTGDKPAAETEASVYIQLFGSRGDSGRRILYHSLNNDTKFQRGEMDMFQLQAVSLDDIERIKIGHDGVGQGSGWYLDKIIIKEELDGTEQSSCRSQSAKKSGKKTSNSNNNNSMRASSSQEQDADDEEDEDGESDGENSIDGENTNNNNEKTDEDKPEPRVWYFKCDDWLEESMGDGLTERELLPSDPPEPEPEKEWTVSVTTGKDADMSTTNEVSLVVYGDKGCSEPIILGSGKEGQFFQRAQTDDFMHDIPDDLGEWYKIRIGHDDEDRESGWYLERIKMKSRITGQLLTFKVKQWMSRAEEDHDVWRELPVELPGKEPLPVVTYTVEVYTGNEEGSETQAEIYVHLFGSRGDSGRRLLYHSLNNDVKFQRGEMDMFQIQAVSLDDIEKIVVGHNAEGDGDGWYVEKIIIREESEDDKKGGDNMNNSNNETQDATSDGEEDENSNNSNSEKSKSKMWYFPCNAWLDMGKDDQKIEKEFAATEPPEEEKEEEEEKPPVPPHKLWIKTTEDSSPPQGSCVVVTVYGEEGKSDDIELHKEGAFEPGNTDEFEIDLAGVGAVYKLRIGRHPQDDWENGWHLEEVKMEDPETKEQYVFTFDRWMSRDQDDCDIVRERMIVKEGDEPLPMQRYEVSVYTGDHWAACTDAVAWMTLFGSKGDSGKRQLFKSLENKDKFCRNQVDKFIIEAVTLEELEKVEIYHDGQGHGAGWFVDKVIIKELEGERMSKQFVFPCNRWLDDHEGDKLTKQELKLLETIDSDEEPKEKSEKESQGSWTVKVKTGDIQNGGTHAKVTLFAYGTKGASDPAPLGEGGSECEDFEPGKEAEFQVKLGDIGDISKIRIEHDSSGDSPDWYLEMITMVDSDTNEELKFYVNRWLSQKLDDGSTCRELAVLRPDQPLLPVLHYQVVVVTSDEEGAGTLADATITLFGEHGDTGSRKLTESLTFDIPNCQGQTDAYIIEAVKLGKLSKVILGHNGENAEDAWFVERVIVKESEHAVTETVFPCKQQIEMKEGTATVELTPSGDQFATELPPNKDGGNKPSEGTWTVWATTGTEEEAKASKAEEQMDTDNTEQETDGDEKKEKQDEADEEKMETDDGKDEESVLKEVYLTIFGTLGQSEPIPLVQGQPGNEECQDDGESKEEKKPDVEEKSTKKDKGKNTAKSAKDAKKDKKQEEVKEKGKGGKEDKKTKSGKTDDKKGKENEAEEEAPVEEGAKGQHFLPGTTDEFKIKLDELGQIYKIRINFDKNVKNPDWFLKKLKMKDDVTGQEFHFHHNNWVKVTEDCVDAAVELPAIRPDIVPPEGQHYVVDVYTGDHLAAGTDANVHITVIGSSGSSGMRQLEKSESHDDKFCRNQVDTFSFDTLNVGELKKVVIGHDGQGHGSGWCLEKVCVKQMDDSNVIKEYLFACGRWLDSHERDCLTERELTPSDIIDKEDEKTSEETEEKSSKGQWTVAVKTGDLPDCNTQAIVTITVYGTKGQSEPQVLESKDSEDSKNDFSVGATTEFKIDVGEIGQIYKIRIEHDNSGPSPAWFLEKVVMKDDDTEEELKFYINRWLADNKEDLQICREMPVSRPDKPILPVLHYEVAVFTGSLDKAGTLAEPSIILHGEHGDSGKRMLKHSQTCDVPFGDGQVDVFIIETVSLGKLSKILLQFNSDDEDDAWYIERVLIKEGKRAVIETVFEYNQWLKADDSGSAQCELSTTEERFFSELPPYKDAVEYPTTEGTWTIWTTTATEEEVQEKQDKEKQEKEEANKDSEDTTDEDKKDKDDKKDEDKKDEDKKTDDDDDKKYAEDDETKEDADKTEMTLLQEVYLTLYGTKGQSQPIPLVQAQTKGGEDDKEPQKDAKADKSKGKEDPKGQSDGKKSKVKEEGKKVKEDEKEKDDSEVAEEKKEFFKPGAKDEFKIKVDDIGEIYKIQIHLDKNLVNPDWLLKKLKMKDDVTGQEFDFFYDDWVRATEENPDATVQLPAIQPDIQPVQENQYLLTLVTGNLVRAETEASIYCTMIGQFGDCGKKLLPKPINSEKAFAAGQMDQFEVQCLNMGKITELIVGHITDGRGRGWYLEYAAVRTSPEATTESIFTCHRWLDTGCEDRELERKLYPLTEIDVAPAKTDEEETEKPESKGVFKCTVHIAAETDMPKRDQDDGEEKKDASKEDESKTAKDDKTRRKSEAEKTDVKTGSAGDKTKRKSEGDIKDAEKKAEDEDELQIKCLQIILYGENGITEPISLEHAGAGVFTCGAVEEFDIEALGIGAIYKVRLVNTLGNVTQSPVWTVKKVEITDVDTKDKFTFDFGNFLGDAEMSHESPVMKSGQHIAPLSTYCITIYGGKQESEEEQKADEKSKGKGTEKTKTAKEEGKKGKEKGKKGKVEEEPPKKSAKKKPIVMPNFTLKLAGRGGDSGIQKLTDGKVSEDEKSVTFNVVAVNLHELHKLSLAVEPQPGIQLPWKLEKVEVKEGEFAPVLYTVNHNEIIFTEEEDVTEDLELTVTSAKPCNEVAIPKEQVPTLPVSEGAWKVVVTTGSDEDNGATGQVMVVLCGEKGESEPLPLTTSPQPDDTTEGSDEKDKKDKDEDGRKSSASKDEKSGDDEKILKPGQEDEFELKVKEDIGDVFKIRLGFADRSKDQKWFVEKLHFTDEHTHDDFTCEINDWLRVDDGKDGWLECPVIWPAIIVPQECMYEVSVYTGNIDLAGTDASVFINIFGERGQSGKRHLRMNMKDSNKFEQGNMDVFEVAAVDLQNLTKVIMSHDGTGIGDGWFLDKVVIKDRAKPNKEFLFECNRWMDEGEDDGALERELFVTEQKPKEGVWKVWVTTGPIKAEDDTTGETSSRSGSAKKDGAESSPSGSAKKGEASKDKPEEKDKDKDGDKKDKNKDEDKKDKDKDEDKKDEDKEEKEEKDENDDESKLPPPISKQVVLVMYGSKGKSKPLPLASEQEKLYQEGATDLFEVEVPEDLGDIYKIRVGFSSEEGLDAEQNWNLHKVKLMCEKTEKDYIFEFKDLLIKNDESDGWKECPVLCDVKEDILEVFTYQVMVHTGSKFGSGTDANVHMEILGERGDTGSRKLLVSQKEGNKFENGRVDIFQIEAVDLKKLEKVTIGHDGAGPGSGWYLDKVIIKESSIAPQKYVFECDRWLDEGEDDGRIELDLDLTKVIDSREPNWKVYVRTSDEDNSSTEAKVFLTVFGDKGDSGPLQLEPGEGTFQSGATEEQEVHVDQDDVGKLKKIRIEHDNSQGRDSAWRMEKIVMENLEDGSRFEFAVDRWLSDHDDNGDVVLELPAKWPDEEPLPVTKYEVKISTGEASKADSDAMIYITLTGKNGDSGKRYLYKNEADGEKWVKGQTDAFQLDAVDLGDLEKVTVGYDQGEEDGWFLDKVEIKNKENEDEKFTFTCNKWFDSTQDDNEVERVLDLDEDNEEEKGKNDADNA